LRRSRPRWVGKEIRRANHKHSSAEEKVRVVREGLRGEDSIADFCRREGLPPNWFCCSFEAWPRLVARIGDLAAEIGSQLRTVPSKSRISPVPFKSNAARRHHIPKQRHRVTNWSEYDAALRQRGSLTLWFSDEAIAAWRAEPRTTRGVVSRTIRPWQSEPP
jgi:hypothetical protein